MGNFFNSEIVKNTMRELAEIQEELIQQVFYVPFMSKEQKREHLVLMKEFLEKQKILFFRMSLSDDPEAQEVKEQIIQNAKLFGVVKDVRPDELFTELEKTIEGLAKILDV